MLRSLFSGISGLKAHQMMLDVTGNNIANVNTTGFKTSSTTFEDTFSQMIKAAGAPVAPNGGTNPSQVGLGVRLAAIQTNFSQGAAQTTGRSTDLLIQGDGFFKVLNGTQELYTRNGSFSLDTAGMLVTSEGYPVQSTAGANITIPPGTYVSYSIANNGDVVGVDGAGTPTVIATIGLATFPNPPGLEKVGGSLYRRTVNSGAEDLGVPGTLRGTLQSGALEMSNVDLGQEFTNLIISQRGFQANSKVITTSDELLQDLVNLKR